jgi:hypothetical protein
LKWKLSLRNKELLYIGKLGIKQLNLSRNRFDDKFAEKLASILLSDEYLKSISL